MKPKERKEAAGMMKTDDLKMYLCRYVERLRADAPEASSLGDAAQVLADPDAPAREVLDRIAVVRFEHGIIRGSASRDRSDERAGYRTIV